MQDESTSKDRQLARSIAAEVAKRGGSTYYVGGCVRDQLLGRSVKDVDIEIHGVPVPELAELLSAFGEVSAIGASFGIYNIKGHTLDIAVPRREDAESRGGRDEMAEVADPFLGTYEAARRRDLTMNALYEDVLTGEVIDHFCGQADLAAGIIRHVDDTTFAQDPLRVLRVAQFAARLDMRVAANTIALCGQLDVGDLPSERVLEELRKALLKSRRPSTFFAVLREMDQLDPWFAEVGALVGVPQNPMWHPEGDVWVHTMRVLDAAASHREQASDPFAFMLSALCHDLGKATTTTEVDGRIVSYGHEEEGVPLARSLLDRLGVSTQTRTYALNMVTLHMIPNALIAQGARRKAYNHLFDRSICPRDLLLLARCDNEGSGDGTLDETLCMELDERLQAFEQMMARPYVQGRDLLEAGMEPGPQMGEVLRHAHKLRLVGMSKEDQLRQCLGFWRGMQREAERAARREAQRTNRTDTKED